jgi:hypothetical protein
VPVDGSVTAGDRTLVAPPSRSKSPAPEPAAAPVTSALLPLGVASTCLTPLELVPAGLARSHAPVVAVSVALGLVVQPVADSKLSV